MPHKKLDKTPYELWKGNPPNLNYLKVWGCLAKVALPEFKREKIGPRTIDTLFTGYAYQSVVYRFITEGANDSYMHGNIIEARDANSLRIYFL